MFEALVACLRDPEKQPSGECVVEEENDGSKERTVRYYVRYNEPAMKILEEIFAIQKKCPEMNLNSYREILEKNGIDWTHESMENVDVSKLDAQCVMALLIGVTRADRFIDGEYKYFLDNGCIRRWILRLKEIEEDNAK